jgi:sodium/bile acid cotransporter 7
MTGVRRLVRLIDPFVVSLLGTVALAAVVPARGSAGDVADAAATVAIGLLFFLYGARLSTREALAGLRHWRLHLTILCCTFAVFPLLGLAARGLVPWLVTEDLYRGLLFLCLVPSTVQSSIAFTSLARGNVPAAIAAGTFSSLLGVVLTPLLAAALIRDGAGGAGLTPDTLLSIGAQLLAPFLLGQVLRRWVGGAVRRHRAVLSLVDRGSILLVVYVAFSAGVTEGIWDEASWRRLVALLGVLAVLLAVMLLLTSQGARRLGFPRGDRVAIVFAGSKKSLAAGLPMATVLFPGEGAAALAVLPLMMFHQLQLLVCAVIARRWARAAPVTERDEPDEPDEPAEAAGPRPARRRRPARGQRAAGRRSASRSAPA